MADCEDDEALPERVPLPEARPLTDDERALLDRVVSHVGVPELAEQAASARVVALCSCGCPSIALDTDGPTVPPDVVIKHEPVGRDDYLLVEGSGPNASGHEVKVALHVLDGRIDEVEIWARWDGRTPPQTDLPAAETLSFDD